MYSRISFSHDNIITSPIVFQYDQLYVRMTHNLWVRCSSLFILHSYFENRKLSFWKMASLVTDDILTKRVKNIRNDGRVIFQVDSVSSLFLITSFTVGSPSKTHRVFGVPIPWMQLFENCAMDRIDFMCLPCVEGPTPS